MTKLIVGLRLRREFNAGTLGAKAWAKGQEGPKAKGWRVEGWENQKPDLKSTAKTKTNQKLNFFEANNKDVEVFQFWLWASTL